MAVKYKIRDDDEELDLNVEFYLTDDDDGINLCAQLEDGSSNVILSLEPEDGLFLYSLSSLFQQSY